MSQIKSVLIGAKVQWIRVEFGGRSSEPVVGLRPTIRFQKSVESWLSGGRDVEITRIDFDKSNWSGLVEMRFVASWMEEECKTRDNLIEGALFELLDSYRVIAVGKIEAVSELNSIGED